MSRMPAETSDRTPATLSDHCMHMIQQTSVIFVLASTSEPANLVAHACRVCTAHQPHAPSHTCNQGWWYLHQGWDHVVCDQVEAVDRGPHAHSIERPELGAAV